jgi:hypothetical protein
MRDVTVVLKYEIPAIRNSDFLTGNNTRFIAKKKTKKTSPQNVKNHTKIIKIS